MGKKKRTKDARKDNFNKVNVIFKNPINTDIVQELSRGPQRPIDLADNIGVKKQAINYHLNELKREGIVQSNKIEIPTAMAGEIALPTSKAVDTGVKIDDIKELTGIGGQIDDLRGLRVNGVDNEGNLVATWGVELTKNGKDIAGTFVNRLYEESESQEGEKNKNKKKEGN